MTEQREIIECPEPGIYYGIPEETYHAWDAFSKSKVGELIKSPAHMQARLREGLDTAAVRLGSLTDTVVFDPDKLLERFSIQPSTYVDDKKETKPWNINAKKCKEILAQLEATGKGKPISNAMYQAAMALREAVKHQPAAMGLLQHGQSQVSIVWDDPDTGVRCKARLDWYWPAHSITDLKTTKDGSLEGFPREMNKYGYHIQAAVYTEAVAVHTGKDLPFFIIAAEKPARNHAVGVYQVGEDSILAGRNVWKRALYKYRECKENNHWPGYSPFIEPIDIPDWAIRAELGEEISNVREF
ncbi:hypothetical protein LCGC14_0297890 [marine sediment metagenome]|uniref:Putative exodeoxyribonuclease 8 PDDEXK-like domain-containing protein n=1 Tax=marine sediment metagenome TaxID=412755 RepID=A0A0F9TR59_9ZZZZ